LIAIALTAHTAALMAALNDSVMEDRWMDSRVVDDETVTVAGQGPDLSNLPLLDHHCHGVVTRDLDRSAFEALLTEGATAGPRGGTLFDSGIGMEVRRRCAPVLGLEPFASPDAYLARRAELGWFEVSRRFLSASGLSGLFVDTGLAGPTFFHGAGDGDSAAAVSARPADPGDRVGSGPDPGARPGSGSALAADLASAADPGFGADLGSAVIAGRADADSALVPAWSPVSLTDPSLLGRLADVPTRTVLRLERIAEDLAAEQIEPGDFPDRVAAAIERLAPGVVAAKTIAGYRCGLALPARQASSAALVHAVSVFLGTARADLARANNGNGNGNGNAHNNGNGNDHGIAGGQPAPASPLRPRLADPTIIRFLIGCAIDNGLPLQVHTGFGDADLNLGESDPVLLTPLLRDLAPTGVPILLLHTYPFQRHAGYLAQVFDNVFCDVGLAIPHIGYRAHHALAELLELAPYGKVLYSSDAYGLPELFYLGAVLFRRSLSRLLGDLDLPADEAARIALMIGQGNAQRVYSR
jgi:uncharacterized protein